MKVVLRSDVEKLGEKGDIVDVADGYARNYLVPRGLAMRATKGVVDQAAAMRRNRDAKVARDREAAQALAAQLTATRVEVKARAGEGGRLFGSVTNADIADAIAVQTGVAIDRRSLQLDEPIKELGPHELGAKLHADVTVTIGVDVVAE
jgi:large subunit ribosomal protein L9